MVLNREEQEKLIQENITFRTLLTYVKAELVANALVCNVKLDEARRDLLIQKIKISLGELSEADVEAPR